MGIFSRRNQTEPKSLDQVVDRLPRQVASWTPEQRAAYTAASDRAMRQQSKRKTKRK
ncbi:hypothetical protein AB0E99_22845 [Streptomyces sp. NPDC030592]|uniref:hypothetical protein n=1 Tax=unclassified Streptomyces TaxID=2593676 RepID=UPI00340B91FA